jgi:hypothetical protein
MAEPKIAEYEIEHCMEKWKCSREDTIKRIKKGIRFIDFGTCNECNEVIYGTDNVGRYGMCKSCDEKLQKEAAEEKRLKRKSKSK